MEIEYWVLRQRKKMAAYEIEIRKLNPQASDYEQQLEKLVSKLEMIYGK